MIEYNPEVKSIYNKRYYDSHKVLKRTGLPKRRGYYKAYYTEHKDELKARRILG
jgi:hypothetical protein